MNMYYVVGTEIEKKKEVTDVRAVNARDLEHLKQICDGSYVRWHLTDKEPCKLSNNW